MSVAVPGIGAEPVRHPWLAVASMGLATFAVVSTEMLPVGLLLPMAEALSVSIGRTGWLISVPAIIAAVSAPLLVLVAGNLDRRWVLRALLALLLVANLLSALAPGFTTMLLARGLVGLCMGGIWAIAGGLAPRLVPAQRIGLATSIIFGGVAAAAVLGVPLGSWIGEAHGWRAAFLGFAGLAAAVLLLQAWVVPALPVRLQVGLKAFGQGLGNQALRRGLCLTVLVVSSHFMVFTFVQPLLDDRSGLPPHWIGSALFAYGCAGLLGNFLVGPWAARCPRRALQWIAGGLLLTPLSWWSVGGSLGMAAVLLLLWGLAYGGVSVGLMGWMLKAAPALPEVTGALYVGVFNIGIAGGAWIGGVLIGAAGLPGLLGTAAAVAAAAWLLATASQSPGDGGATV